MTNTINVFTDDKVLNGADNTFNNVGIVSAEAEVALLESENEAFQNTEEATETCSVPEDTSEVWERLEEAEEAVSDEELWDEEDEEDSADDILLDDEEDTEESTEICSMPEDSTEVPERLTEAERAVSVGDLCGEGGKANMPPSGVHPSTGGELRRVSFELEAINCVSRSAVDAEESVLSIVKTQKCGKRVTISRSKVLDRLGVKDTVQVACLPKSGEIIIANDLGGTSYNLKKSHGKAVIYNTPLVEYLTNALKLNFATVTTHSFYEVEFVNHDIFGLVAIVR